MVGAPLLLAERLRWRKPWGAGKLTWFAAGVPPWLFVSHEVLAIATGKGKGLHGEPLISAYLVAAPFIGLCTPAALLAGGWFRARHRRRFRRSWRERFGILLGLAWVCNGLLLLYINLD